MWEINLKMRTAKAGGVTVEFKPVPAGGKVDANCFRDMEGLAWRGKITPMSAAIRNEREKIHTLQAAVDAYSKATRKAFDPFPVEN